MVCHVVCLMKGSASIVGETVVVIWCVIEHLPFAYTSTNILASFLGLEQGYNHISSTVPLYSTLTSIVKE